MAKLKVELVTPEKRMFSVEADEVIAPGGVGLFGVLPGHAPFLSVVEPGVLTLREGQSTQTWFVGGGFVEVANDSVRLLADQAEPVSAIDVAAARKRYEEAQEKLKQLTSRDANYELEAATVRRETARMNAAGR